jgi:hypothetical protein
MKTIRLRLIEKVATRDAATTDMVLSCPTAEELKAWAASIAKDGVKLGMVWTGLIEPILDGFPREALKAMLERIAVYGEMSAAKEKPNRTTPATFGVGAHPQSGEALADFNRRLAAGDTENIRSMNDANREFWDKHLNR